MEFLAFQACQVVFIRECKSISYFETHNYFLILSSYIFEECSGVCASIFVGERGVGLQTEQFLKQKAIKPFLSQINFKS